MIWINITIIEKMSVKSKIIIISVDKSFPTIKYRLMSKIQQMLNDRAESIINSQQCDSYFSQIKYRITTKICERKINKEMEEGGRTVLKSAFEHIPFNIFR